MKIRKGDMVMVTTGKDKGKTGKVLLVNCERERVLVERLNMCKRHQKPNQTSRQGGIVEKEALIHVSNVMIYDEKAQKATRVGMKMVNDKKVRVSRKSGEILDAK